MLKTLPILAACCLIMLALPSTALGASEASSVDAAVDSSATTRPVGKWAKRVAAVESLLEEGSSEEAFKKAEQTLRSMRRRDQHPIQKSDEALGTVHLLRAVAMAGQGREREAIWQYHLVRQLFPDLPVDDLHRFGAAGQLLLDHPLEKSPTVRASGRKTVQDLAPPAEATRPRKVSGVYPSLMQGLLLGDLRVNLAVIVNAEGATTFPEVIETQGNLTMALFVLDFLMDWTFEPAMLDGESIAVRYILAYNHNQP